MTGRKTRLTIMDSQSSEDLDEEAFQHISDMEKEGWEVTDVKYQATTNTYNNIVNYSLCIVWKVPE